MDVYNNMAFGLKLRKVPKKEIDRRVREVAEMLGIADKLRAKPRELSGGQRQRVALGRAIVRNPKVFLFDEPLSNLDAKLRVRMRAELQELHQRLKTTSIYVTHDQVEAMTMGDRIAVMKDGIIQQVDTPLGLYSSPVNMFVAGFIGTPAMNFVDAKIELSDGSAYISTSSFRVKAPPAKAEKLKAYAGKPVVFGVRPEDIFDKALTSLVKATPENTIKATVDVIEPMGPVVTMYLNANGNSLIATIDADTKARENEEIELVLDLDKTHVFDKETEQAIC